jgi:hypothetical protein
MPPYILKFFDANPDPGSCQPWIRDPGWKKSDPGSGGSVTTTKYVH